MNEPAYRGAIIGLGFIGGADQVSGDALGQQVSDLDGTHLAAMQNHPRVNLVAGSSRDPGRRERFSQRTSAKTYADWREMLAGEQLDIVSVATYAPQHARMTIACAEAGVRAVLCEKPIATSLPEAERMLASCAASGTLLAVNHNRRFHPDYRRLRDFIATGELGELTSASVQWASGRLGNVGTHVFNALCMLTGRQVEAVSATLDLSGKPDCRGPEFQDPGGYGVLRLHGGLPATFDALDYATVPASITINGKDATATIGAGGVTIDHRTGSRDHWPPAERTESSMDVALREIVDSLDGKVAFSDPPENSLHTLETIIACHASHRRNAAWVELPLQSDDRELIVHSG
ncbi:MAG: gfo/Idh/MocA family oxidoreductase [Planctomycetota bacterium]|nr:MAG: gfo/Idh/MocA family oxidoreductase [Planctomycetota bacterium]REJ87789.1 MAG: gfo/Idh/MocA family oxidoreductase [Planctomycetota bacterium]REK27873.1 MAG: gfo/Idh/MocA family oxidoreductase [Planctomycetota bacterium]REK32815.1 MAG: gfo/Idh/MocA family oxidoreductase [Planctomycetota bacterium]